MRTIDGLRVPRLAACVVLSACLLSTCLLSACGGASAPTPAQPAPPPAELQTGDVHVIASAVDTMALPQRVTRQYGIPRGEQVWMLLVTVRRGSGSSETSATAKVEARAQTLGGNNIAIPLRATPTAANYIDYIGTFSIAGPDTLRFTVDIAPDGAPPAKLEFTREIPRS